VNAPKRSSAIFSPGRTYDSRVFCLCRSPGGDGDRSNLTARQENGLPVGLQLADASVIPACRYLEMTMTAPDPSTELMRLINSYQVSQGLHVAAMLGVADHLRMGQSRTKGLPRCVARIQGRSIDCCAPWRGRGLSGVKRQGICADALGPADQRCTASRRNYARWIRHARTVEILGQSPTQHTIGRKMRPVHLGLTPGHTAISTPRSKLFS